MIPSCDQTGVPHFHSSTTSGSASLMSLRMRARASPCQPARPAILSSISTEAGGPAVEADFFIAFSNRELLLPDLRRLDPALVLPRRPDRHGVAMAEVVFLLEPRDQLGSL